ncbi:Membrane protein involved in the export of O-antigen and teichoic acid [Asanoa hainanensis]|uniref:Membrane protein involved in the export of O-antigen and teichoic acid n=1 Tax=Asanoa hainanensis TaxID=560556 RepID=A0A239GW66_9ACTN|nr:polysaccharide biosynthesis C-terminal domain-containing protein [Asanoa hainanensis]SNS72304.1 Membrane protein involved in the export of O-antigen and teichoic acid [Asanoa hainanensis]
MTVDAGRRPSLTVASGLLGLSSIASRLATLVVMALLARGAGAEAVGHYGLATLGASLTAAALSFGLVTHLTREVAAGTVPADEVARLHAGRLALFAVATLCAWPFAAAAFVMFFAASLLEQWNETAWVLVRGTAKAWREAAVNGAAGALLVAACALAALHGGLTLDTAAVLVLAAAAVRSLAALAATGAWRVRPGRVAVRDRVRGSLPYFAADLLGLVYFRGDVFVLALFVTAAEVGSYVAAAGIVGPAVQVAAAMGVGALAFAARRGSPNEPTAIYRFFQVAGTAAAGLLLVALPIGVTVLFGTAPEVLSLTAVLALFLALRFANYGLSAILLAAGGAASRLLVLVYCVAGNLLLNLLLDGTYGAAGAAWATVLTELIVAGSMLWFIRDRALVRPVLVGIAMVAAAAAVLVVVGRFGSTPAVLATGALLVVLAAGQARGLLSREARR